MDRLSDMEGFPYNSVVAQEYDKLVADVQLGWGLEYNTESGDPFTVAVMAIETSETNPILQTGINDPLSNSL